MTDSRQITKLLWTGGWDSTFRLLQLLLSEKKIVQPYYLKFPSEKTDIAELPVRKSTEKELRVMQAIRNRLIENYSHTKELLLPLKIFDASVVVPDKKIVKSFSKIVQSKYIGKQYVWLASFAKQYHLKNLEMGIEAEGNTKQVIEPFIKRKGKTYLVNDRYSSRPEHILFNYFSFPILEYSKRDMAEISEKENWTELMKMTWFCHRPYFGKFPCGSCNPCVNAYEDGMGWRIPLFFRIFGRIFKTLYHAKVVIKLRNSLS